MRNSNVLATIALLVVAACTETTAPRQLAVAPDDGVFVSSIAVDLGALADYLGPALRQIRQRDPNACDAQRQEMEQIRLRLRECERDGDADRVQQERYRLRLAAAQTIRAGLSDAPLDEMLSDNERMMAELQLRIRERISMREDPTGEQEQLRIMQQLQEQARTARAEDRAAEALELAARVREQVSARAAQP